MVRAKMTLTGKTQHSWGGQTLRFDCQYDPNCPEDQRFTKATPSGHVEMAVDNPAALEQFEVGKAYYVDFHPAD